MSGAEATLAGVLLGAVIGGGISILVAMMTAKATTARDIERFRHEAREAAEARRQRRLEGAYVHLLAVVNEIEELMETDRVEREPPDYEAASRRMKAIWAEMDAFGSAVVHEWFRKLRSAWLLFPIGMNNARVRARGGSSDSADLEHLDALLKDARMAATGIRRQVSAELRGEDWRSAGTDSDSAEPY